MQCFQLSRVLDTHFHLRKCNRVCVRMGVGTCIGGCGYARVCVCGYCIDGSIIAVCECKIKTVLTNVLKLRLIEQRCWWVVGLVIWVVFELMKVRKYISMHVMIRVQYLICKHHFQL